MEVSANSVQRAFVYSGGKLVAMQATDGQFYWLHTNHLGNSRAMTDGSGNLTYKGQFDPYGASLTEWSASGNANLNNKKFTGYERDTSGLDYANARMYNSARGRFQTPDPMGMKAANHSIPQSLNRYSYVLNDPVNATDSTGNFLSYCEWKFWEFFSGDMISWVGFLEATNDRCGLFNLRSIYNKLAGEVGGGGGSEQQPRLPCAEQTTFVGISSAGGISASDLSAIVQTAVGEAGNYPQGGVSKPEIDAVIATVINRLYFNIRHQESGKEPHFNGGTTVTGILQAGYDAHKT